MAAEWSQLIWNKIGYHQAFMLCDDWLNLNSFLCLSGSCRENELPVSLAQLGWKQAMTIESQPARRKTDGKDVHRIPSVCGGHILIFGLSMSCACVCVCGWLIEGKTGWNPACGPRLHHPGWASLCNWEWNEPDWEANGGISAERCLRVEFLLPLWCMREQCWG